MVDTTTRKPAQARRVNEGHIAGFDGLRCIAVALVVSSHVSILLYGDKGIFSRLVLRSGWIGVDLFFALSGFLITSLLLREHRRNGRLDVPHFYGRRAVRLLPALVVMLAVHTVYTLLSGRPEENAHQWVSVLYSLLYVENWHVALRPLNTATDLGHVWSLGVEEQFYLVWPFVMLLFTRRFKGTWLAPAILVGLAAVMTAHRVQFDPTLWLEPLIRTDTRPVAMVLGAAGAWVWNRRTLPTWLVHAAFVVGVAAFVVVVNRPVDDAMFVLLVASIGAPLIVLSIAHGVSPVMAALEWRPVRAIGRVSYGFYLWHHPVFWATLRHAGTLSIPVRFVIAFGLSIGLTLLSWYLIEQPLSRRWRKRFEARSAAATVAASVPMRPVFTELT
jgi:peptidoglycan/LPS O-acetylase OafA/YrhL